MKKTFCSYSPNASTQDRHRKGGLKVLSYIQMYTYCNSVTLLEQSNMFKGTWFSSAQRSFIPKFLVDFCNKICRADTVLARSKVQKAQNFPKKNFGVSLDQDFIFQFHIYFSTSSPFNSQFYTNNLKLTRWFLLTLKR